jgi:hypothetical protein
MAVMFSFCFAATAYASELPEEASQPEAVDIMTQESQEFVLEDGYFYDEQGQIYYDASRIKIEEPVIEDIVQDDTEEIIAEEPVETIEEPVITTEEPVKTADDKVKAADKSAEDKTKEQKAEPVVEKPSYSEADLRLLSSLIYAEAGCESYNGMLAVANVVLNRVKSDVYWHVNTIKEVIYDHKWSVQFAVTIKNSKTRLSMLDKALKCYDTGKFSGPNRQLKKRLWNGLSKQQRPH